MRIPFIATIVALTVGCVGLARPALAQIESREGIALQDQIYELRHDLDQLRSQGGGSPQYSPPPAAPEGGGGAGVSSDLATQLLDRVNRLEDEVRTLRGRIDEIDNARQRAEADLAKQIGDLQFRLTSGAPTPAPGGAPATAEASRAAAPPAGTLTPPLTPPVSTRRTPEVTLQAGNLALAHHDYVTAEQDARDVLAGTKGPRTTDALYLLAQSLTGQHNYQAAAIAYDDTYNRGARGYRAQDSLLGLANSLNSLGDKQAACETLNKLRAEFPSPRPDLHSAIAAARQRTNCH